MDNNANKKGGLVPPMSNVGTPAQLMRDGDSPFLLDESGKPIGTGRMLGSGANEIAKIAPDGSFHPGDFGGQQGLAYAQGLIRNSGGIAYQQHGNEHYGRPLYSGTLGDGRDFSEEMVRSGWSSPLTGSSADIQGIGAAVAADMNKEKSYVPGNIARKAFLAEDPSRAGNLNIKTDIPQLEANLPDEIRRGVNRGGNMIASSTGGLESFVGEVLGNENLIQGGKKMSADANARSNKGDNLAAIPTTDKIHSFHDLVLFGGGAFGSIVPQVIPQGVAAIATGGMSVPAQMGVQLLMNAPNILGENEAEKLNHTNMVNGVSVQQETRGHLWEMMPHVVLQTAMDQVGFHGITKALKAKTLARAAGDTALGATSEGITEGLQKYDQETLLEQIDKNHTNTPAEKWKKAWEDGAQGFFGGGGVSAIHAGIEYMKPDKNANTPGRVQGKIPPGGVDPDAVSDTSQDRVGPSVKSEAAANWLSSSADSPLVKVLGPFAYHTGTLGAANSAEGGLLINPGIEKHRSENDLLKMTVMAAQTQLKDKLDPKVAEHLNEITADAPEGTSVFTGNIFMDALAHMKSDPKATWDDAVSKMLTDPTRKTIRPIDIDVQPPSADFTANIPLSDAVAKATNKKIKIHNLLTTPALYPEDAQAPETLSSETANNVIATAEANINRNNDSPSAWGVNEGSIAINEYISRLGDMYPHMATALDDYLQAYRGAKYIASVPIEAAPAAKNMVDTRSALRDFLMSPWIPSVQEGAPAQGVSSEMAEEIISEAANPNPAGGRTKAYVDRLTQANPELINAFRTANSVVRQQVAVAASSKGPKFASVGTTRDALFKVLTGPHSFSKKDADGVPVVKTLKNGVSDAVANEIIAKVHGDSTTNGIYHEGAKAASDVFAYEYLKDINAQFPGVVDNYKNAIQDAIATMYGNETHESDTLALHNEEDTDLEGDASETTGIEADENVADDQGHALGAGKFKSHLNAFSGANIHYGDRVPVYERDADGEILRVDGKAVKLKDDLGNEVFERRYFGSVPDGRELTLDTPIYTKDDGTEPYVRKDDPNNGLKFRSTYAQEGEYSGPDAGDKKRFLHKADPADSDTIFYIVADPKEDPATKSSYGPRDSTVKAYEVKKREQEAAAVASGEEPNSNVEIVAVRGKLEAEVREDLAKAEAGLADAIEANKTSVQEGKKPSRRTAPFEKEIADAKQQLGRFANLHETASAHKHGLVLGYVLRHDVPAVDKSEEAHFKFLISKAILAGGAIGKSKIQRGKTGRTSEWGRENFLHIVDRAIDPNNQHNDQLLETKALITAGMHLLKNDELSDLSYDVKVARAFKSAISYLANMKLPDGTNRYIVSAKFGALSKKELSAVAKGGYKLHIGNDHVIRSSADDRLKMTLKDTGTLSMGHLLASELNARFGDTDRKVYISLMNELNIYHAKNGLPEIKLTDPDAAERAFRGRGLDSGEKSEADPRSVDKSPFVRTTKVFSSAETRKRAEQEYEKLVAARDKLLETRGMKEFLLKEQVLKNGVKNASGAKTKAAAQAKLEEFWGTQLSKNGDNIHLRLVALNRSISSAKARMSAPLSVSDTVLNDAAEAHAAGPTSSENDGSAVYDEMDTRSGSHVYAPYTGDEESEKALRDWEELKSKSHDILEAFNNSASKNPEAAVALSEHEAALNEVRHKIDKHEERLAAVEERRVLAFEIELVEEEAAKAKEANAPQYADFLPLLKDLWTRYDALFKKATTKTKDTGLLHTSLNAGLGENSIDDKSYSAAPTTTLPEKGPVTVLEAAKYEGKIPTDDELNNDILARIKREAVSDPLARGAELQAEYLARRSDPAVAAAETVEENKRLAALRQEAIADFHSTVPSRDGEVNYYRKSYEDRAQALFNSFVAEGNVSEEDTQAREELMRKARAQVGAEHIGSPSQEDLSAFIAEQTAQAEAAYVAKYMKTHALDGLSKDEITRRLYVEAQNRMNKLLASRDGKTPVVNEEEEDSAPAESPTIPNDIQLDIHGKTTQQSTKSEAPSSTVDPNVRKLMDTLDFENGHFDERTMLPAIEAELSKVGIDVTGMSTEDKLEAMRGVLAKEDGGTRFVPPMRPTTEAYNFIDKVDSEGSVPFMLAKPVLNIMQANNIELLPEGHPNRTEAAVQALRDKIKAYEDYKASSTQSENQDANQNTEGKEQGTKSEEQVGSNKTPSSEKAAQSNTDYSGLSPLGRQYLEKADLGKIMDKVSKGLLRAMKQNGVTVDPADTAADLIQKLRAKALELISPADPTSGMTPEAKRIYDENEERKRIKGLSDEELLAQMESSGGNKPEPTRTKAEQAERKPMISFRRLSTLRGVYAKLFPGITIRAVARQSNTYTKDAPRSRGFANKKLLEVTLVQENILDEVEAHRVFLHEILGHIGVPRALGPEAFADLLKTIEIVAKSTMDHGLGAMLNTKKSTYSNSSRDDQLEEVLADISGARKRTAARPVIRPLNEVLNDTNRDINYIYDVVNAVEFNIKSVLEGGGKGLDSMLERGGRAAVSAVKAVGRGTVNVTNSISVAGVPVGEHVTGAVAAAANKTMDVLRFMQPLAQSLYIRDGALGGGHERSMWYRDAFNRPVGDQGGEFKDTVPEEMRMTLSRLVDKVLLPGVTQSGNFERVPGYLGRAISSSKRAEYDRIVGERRRASAFMLANPDATSHPDPAINKYVQGTRAIMEGFNRDIRANHRMDGSRLEHSMPRIIDREAWNKSENEEDIIKILIRHGATPAQAVARYEQFSISTSLADIDLVNPLAPAFDFTKNMPPALLKDLSPYFQQDIEPALIEYARAITKRAVYNDRFGSLVTLKFAAQGKTQTIWDPVGKIKEMLNAVHTEGPLKGQPIYTKHERDYVVQESWPAHTGTLGGRMSPTLRAVNSWGITYMNYTILALSVAANLVDPAGIAVRNEGALAVLAEAVKLAWSWMSRGDYHRELHELNIMIGNVQSDLADHLGNEQAGYLTAGPTHLNALLFKYNGMKAWNEMSRLLGLAVSRSAISRYARDAVNMDLDPSARARATDDLAELGITREQAQGWVDAGMPIQGYDYMLSAQNKWVDGAIVRPSAALRPGVLSDQRYAVFAFLKGFMWGIYEIIFKRMLHNMERRQGLERAYAPSVMVLTTLPLAMAGYALRTTIANAGVDDEDKKKKKDLTALDYMIRSGIFGPATMGAEMYKATETQHSALAVILGPWASLLSDILTKPIEDSVQTKMPLLSQSRAYKNEMNRILPIPKVEHEE